MFPICHRETVVACHMGSRVHLYARTGGGQVFACSRRDWRWRRFSVPSCPLPIRILTRGYNSDPGCKTSNLLLMLGLLLTLRSSNNFRTSLPCTSSFFSDGHFFAHMSHTGVPHWPQHSPRTCIHGSRHPASFPRRRVHHHIPPHQCLSMAHKGSDTNPLQPFD